VRHYTGVEAEQSFVDENGSVFDCIPIEQQPALRATGGRAATPSDLPQGAAGAAPGAQQVVQLGPIAAINTATRCWRPRARFRCGV
jgi:hypothetical protein